MFDPHLGDPTDNSNGGPDRNVVRLVRRLPETPGTTNDLFKVDVSPFPGDPGQTGPAVAGSALWVAEEFTTLRVQSNHRRNGSDLPQPTAYDLVPVRLGSCRGFKSPDHEYANRDFWVTPVPKTPVLFRGVPDYASNNRVAVDGTPMRVWHSSPLLHVPRAEDFGTDGASRKKGSALMSWVGFLLKPRNLFDGTPLLPR